MTASDSWRATGKCPGCGKQLSWAVARYQCVTSTCPWCSNLGFCNTLVITFIDCGPLIVRYDDDS